MINVQKYFKYLKLCVFVFKIFIGIHFKKHFCASLCFKMHKGMTMSLCLLDQLKKMVLVD